MKKVRLYLKYIFMTFFIQISPQFHFSWNYTDDEKGIRRKSGRECRSERGYFQTAQYANVPMCGKGGGSRTTTPLIPICIARQTAALT